MSLHLVDLSMVKMIYPQYSERIEDLYERNPDFRSLCADYVLCRKSLEEFQKQFAEKQSSIREYEEVTADLERELLDFLYSKMID